MRAVQQLLLHRPGAQMLAGTEVRVSIYLKQKNHVSRLALKH